tara:strand:+ start:353 stop:571 length:219 start_codon:yes stop_codon:yes gene_type:complete
MSKLKQKSYRVYITQYVRPIDVMAVSTTQAKRIATEDHTWEVVDADIRAEKQEESKEQEVIDRKDYQYRGNS